MKGAVPVGEAGTAVWDVADMTDEKIEGWGEVLLDRQDEHFRRRGQMDGWDISP